MSQQPPQKSNTPKLADTEALNKFLQLQEKELGLRQNEFTLRKQESEQNYKFSEKALEAQVQDNERSRTHYRTVQLHRIISGLIVLVIGSGLFGYALYLGKDQIAIEALKILGTLIVGGIGGYGLGRLKAGSSTKDEDDGAKSS